MSQKREQVETHTQQFRGLFVPDHPIKLLTRGEITTTDLCLMMIIDAHVALCGKGCLLSDKQLAEYLHKRHLYISQRIQYLSERRLVIVIHCDGQRYLEVDWSRKGDEKEVPGKYGEILRETLENLRKERSSSTKKVSQKRSNEKER